MRTKLWLNIALPLIVYAAAALIITAPLITQLDTWIAGAGYGDSFELLRQAWGWREALHTGSDPYFQALFAYPDGFYAPVQWAQPLVLWPLAALALIFPPVVAFNLATLGLLALSGWAAYRLCWAVLPAESPRTAPALIGGLVFAAYPAIQGHASAGQLNLLTNVALPLVALFLYRIVSGQGTPRTAIYGALALWAQCLSNYMTPVFAALPFALFGGLALIATRRLTRRIIVQAAIMFIGAGALCLPFFAPLIADSLRPDRPIFLDDGGEVAYSTDPLAFIAPSPFTPIGRELAPQYSRTVLGVNSLEGTAYVGAWVGILAGVGVLSRRGMAGFWAAIAVGCALFSLGPLLKWNDAPLQIVVGGLPSYVPLPWALFQNLPLVDISRTPGRFNVTTGLPVGVLAALGLSAVFRRLPRLGLRVTLTAALIGLILADYQLFAPFTMHPNALPPYFETLRGRADVRAVLNVPFEDLLAQKFALHEQMTHTKPLIGGHVWRRTPVPDAKIALLSDLALGRAYMWDSGGRLVTADRDAIRAGLRAAGADVIVIHTATLDRESVLAFGRATYGEPAHLDNDVIIFEVPPPDGQAAPTPILAFQRAGWWRDPAQPDTAWTTGDGAALYLYTPNEEDHQWTLQTESLLTARALTITAGGRIGEWRVMPAPQTRSFYLNAPPGYHEIRLGTPCTPIPVPPRCLDGACTPPPTPESRCLGVGVSGIGRAAAGEMRFRPSGAMFAGGIGLVGFRVVDSGRAGGLLTVSSTWEAKSRPAGNLHLFFHVLDSAGQLVAQDDFAPHLPESWDGGRWDETATIWLPEGLPSGAYRVVAGWYAYPEGGRLPRLSPPDGPIDQILLTILTVLAD